jgi:peptide/nickel transport system substrate-binding protein
VVRGTRQGWSLRFLAGIAGLALVASACSGGGSKAKSARTSTATTIPNGGTLTIGAEQEPKCADWIDACSSQIWGSWILEAQTMPRAFDVVRNGDDWVYRPSNLLTGEPDVQTSPQQVVTYHIDPQAKWSDGQPITSADFRYTWDQVAHGENIYDQTGYQNIASVDTPDPHTAVVRFSTPYAAWKGLFGGLYGVFPSHLLQGKDRDALMKDGYTWSGGPWRMESWQRGTSLTLVPNPQYWGPKPHLDRVVFLFLATTSSEFDAFKAGTVQAIYPQPELDVVNAIEQGLPTANSKYTANTGNLEALWFNNGRSPLDSRAVRQAVAYSIDRDEIVDRLFGMLGVHHPSQTLDAPTLAPYTDTKAFAGYRLDLGKVDQLMTGDGWAKGANGVWTKAGKPVSLQLLTNANNQRRSLTMQIVQEQLKRAGFTTTIRTVSSDDLGGVVASGDFQVALYAQVLTQLDPADCSIFCSDNIPTPANGNSGQNWQRVNIPDLDGLLKTVETSLDESARKKAGKQAAKIEAANMIALPLDPLPNILLWSKRIVGPVDDNPIYSMFVNMNEWGLRP